MTVLNAGQQVAGRHPHGCDACGSTWLVAAAGTCPLCHRGELVPSDARVVGVPELVHPFAIREADARRALAAHIARGTMPVPRAARLQMVAHHVPMWLVDAHVHASFQAEVGFDYQVQSTVERCTDEQWASIEVEETRIRWEPRAGTLDRALHNAPAPALSTWAQWQQVLEVSDQGGGGDDLVDGTPILLPEQPPELAWPQAEAVLRQQLEEVVGQAAGAQHARELYLRPQWADRHWTWVLLPVYSAAYTDAAGVVRVLRVDGRTGHVSGPVGASSRKGWLWAGLWFSAGATVLAVSAVSVLSVLLFPPLLLLSLAGGALGFLLLGLSLVPLLRVYRANRALPAEDPLLPAASPRGAA